MVVSGAGGVSALAAVKVSQRANGLVSGLYGHCSLGGKRVIELTFDCVSGTYVGPSRTPRSMGSRLTGVGGQRSSVVHFVHRCRRRRLGPVMQATGSVTIHFSTVNGRLRGLVLSRLTTDRRERATMLRGMDRRFNGRTSMVGRRKGRLATLCRVRRQSCGGLLRLVRLCSRLSAYNIVSNGQGRGLGARVIGLVGA